MSRRAVVTGWGHGLPVKVVTNHDLSRFVDTDDAWIRQRTGIVERRICSGDEGNHSLSIAAGREALAKSGLRPEEVDLVMVATVSGDYIWPSVACFVQDALGCPNAGAVDISAACAGFIYAVAQAAAMIETGLMTNILVIGVDTLSKQIDWSDRSTCVLFGDAAAAVMLSAKENTDRGVLQTFVRSNGAGAHSIRIEVGGTKNPPNKPIPEGLDYAIKMAGAEVYKFAVSAMGDACDAVLARAGLTADDIDLFVPHQANLRIITASADRFNLPEEKVFINVDRYGNTSGGSIPLALYEAAEQGRLKPGMKVLTVGFGAGLVWGANIIVW